MRVLFLFCGLRPTFTLEHGASAVLARPIVPSQTGLSPAGEPEAEGEGHSCRPQQLVWGQHAILRSWVGNSVLHFRGGV